jgi:hypothetical protein
MLVNFNGSTWHHVPEDSALNISHCKNLKNPAYVVCTKLFCFTHLLLFSFWSLVLIQHHSILLHLPSVCSGCETWNFYRSSSLKTTVRELTEYKLDLVGVQARWYRGGTEPAYSYIEHGSYFFFVLSYLFIAS